jgi:hypothetical protein
VTSMKYSLEGESKDVHPDCSNSEMNSRLFLDDDRSVQVGMAGHLRSKSNHPFSKVHNGYRFA